MVVHAYEPDSLLVSSEHMLALAIFDIPDASLPIITTRDKVVVVQLEAQHSTCVSFEGQRGIVVSVLGEVPDTNGAITAAGNDNVLLHLDARNSVSKAMEPTDDTPNRSQY